MMNNLNINRLIISMLWLLLISVCISCINKKAEVAVFPQLAHSGSIIAMAFSPDGKQFISASYDKTIKLWDVASERLIRTFFVNKGMIMSIAFSPDGKYILSGSLYGIQLWDAASGKEIRNYSGDTDWGGSASFSKDGKLILSYKFKEIKIHKTSSGQEILTISDPEDHILHFNVFPVIHTNPNSIETACFSPDEKQILCGYLDGKVKIFDAFTGLEKNEFKAHGSGIHMHYGGGVNSIVFSLDGKQILTAGSDGIKLWDAESYQELKRIIPNNVDFDWIGKNKAAFSPDGKFILLNSFNSCQLLDASTGQEAKAFPVVYKQGTFSRDGKNLLLYSNKNTFELWNIENEEKIKTFTGHTDRISSVSISPDGKHILSNSKNKVFYLWDMENGMQIKTFPEQVQSLFFSPDGKHAVSIYDKEIKLWDTESGLEIRAFSGHEERVASISFNSDGRQFLSFSSWPYNVIKLWDTENGYEIREFTGYTSSINSVYFSPDDKHMILCLGTEIKLINLENGQEANFFGNTQTSGFTPGNSYFNRAIFSPDEKMLLISEKIKDAAGSILKLWNVDTEQEIINFPGYIEAVNFTMFSPDGKMILSRAGHSFNRNFTFTIWSTETGHEIKTFTGHTDLVESASFCPDGKRVVSSSQDGTMRLWDISTGKEIAQFISFNDGEWVIITPDGYYNASANGDNHLNVRVGNNIFGIEQYRDTFYRPDIVKIRIQGDHAD